jgi:formate dehydrogenase subunit gamma
MSGQEWSAETAARVVREHAGGRGPLLPVLHALQETFGWISPESVRLVAHELNLSRADVHGVVTFYPDLRTAPTGRLRVAVCRGEACQARGSRELASYACESLGVGFGETTDDGAVTLDEVFCLGNCALPPSVLVDGRLVGRVDAARFDSLVRR